MQSVLQTILDSGVSDAALMDGSAVIYDPSFRKMCECNACGRYGQYYVCPPHIGEIDALIAKAAGYPKAVLYQNISEVKSASDIEGMEEAGKRNHECALRIQQKLLRLNLGDFLHLTSGGCDLCERCGVLDGVPCRHPDMALSNMESYGIYVSGTAEKVGLRYRNGENTVTYFGIVLFRD